MTFTKQTTTIESAISIALNDLESLGNELQDSFDATPESLQGTDANQAKSEAAEVLQNIDVPEIPEKFRALEITLNVPHRNKPSRLLRQTLRDDYIQVLAQVIEFFQELDDEESSDLQEQLQAIIDDCEAVDLPGRTA